MLSSVVLSGCQQMPGGQAMRQYQLESDRLLNEFRAQKKRAEDLEVRNAQLEQRLDFLCFIRTCLCNGLTAVLRVCCVLCPCWQ